MCKCVNNGHLWKVVRERIYSSDLCKGHNYVMRLKNVKFDGDIARVGENTMVLSFCP